MSESFTFTQRVSFGDCDPAGIVFTGRIPGFALTAIEAFWEHAFDGDGWYQMELDRGLSAVFAHLDVDFRSPITPRAPLDCTVVPTRIGTSSLAFRVEGYQGATLCFEANFVNVTMDAKSRVKIPVPDWLRAGFAPWMPA